MNIQDIVVAVAARAGLDQPTTEKAVGTILSVLQHEADGAQVAALFAKLPGAADLAQRYDVMAVGAPGGGLLSSLGSLLGGKAEALINGVTQLEQSGLDITQIRQASATLFQHAETAAGPALVGDVVNAVPGLKGHLGL